MSTIIFIIELAVAIYATVILVRNYKMLRTAIKLSYFFVILTALNSAFNMPSITILCAIACVICMCYDICKTGDYRKTQANDEDVETPEE